MINSSASDAVTFADGSRGRLVPSPSPNDLKATNELNAMTELNAMAEVVLDSGQHLFLPLDALVPHEEGGHRVAAHPSGFEAEADEEAEIIIPLVAETLIVGKREAETGKVRFRTTVTERTETVDEPLFRSEVTTKRVLINQFVDSAPAVRYEGETMIIPIMEEVLVVEKRLRLKEEMHISQVRTEYRDPQTVTLRREVFSEERLPAANVLPSDI